MSKLQHISFVLFFFIGIIIGGCTDDKKTDVFYSEDELPISAYLEAHADKYSTLIEVLDITDIKPALNAYGHFTFFAPDNEAFDEFIALYGHTSIRDFDVEFLASLIRYHLINKEIETSYLPDGVLPDTTWSGDNLVFDFGEGGLNNVLINGKSKIIERDVRVANGFINRVDHVFDPVVLSVYDKLVALGTYTIFTEALSITGYADTLKKIYISLTNEITVKSHFTLFCESDAVFSRDSISDINDLKKRYSDSDDPLSSANGLHKFMGYHCLPSIYYLNQLDSFNYVTLTPNKLLSIKLNSDILLNYRSFDPLIRVIPENSNISARNGVIHAIDKVIKIIDPLPSWFIFDLTSYPGLEIGNSYTAGDLEEMGNIKCEKTGLWYRMSLLDEDSSYLETTTSALGWTVEFDIPPLVTGKYKVTLHWVSDHDRTESVQAFWDGDMLGPVFSMRQQKRPPMVPPEWLYDFRVAMELGTIIVDETRPHKIKFFALSEGLGEFDYLSFTPV